MYVFPFDVVNKAVGPYIKIFKSQILRWPDSLIFEVSLILTIETFLYDINQFFSHSNGAIQPNL